MLAGLVMVAAAAASWGTWSLFLRPTHLPATVTGPIMFASMAVAALPFAMREARARWDRTSVALLLANTAFDAINVLTFFAALDYTTVAIATLTHYLAPILIALAAPWVEGRRAPGARPAAVVALVGLAIVLEPWHAPAAGAAIGAALGAASAVCYAGNTLVVSQLAVRIGTARAISYHSVLAALVLLPLGWSRLAVATPGALGLVAAGGVTIGAGAGIVFVIGLLRVGAARAAVLTYAEPLVAVLVGALVWDEPLHPAAALGGALVLAAGLYVSRHAASDRDGPR